MGLGNGWNGNGNWLVKIRFLWTTRIVGWAGIVRYRFNGDLAIRVELGTGNWDSGSEIEGDGRRCHDGRAWQRH